MPTKFRLSNYGPNAKELLVVLLDDNDAPRMDAICSKHVVARYQVHEVKLEAEQALIVRPVRPARKKGGT